MRSVLVIDDDESIRKSLRLWLKQWQFSVRGAGNSRDALVLMAAAPSEIVLCDLQMASLMAQVKQRWPGTVLIIMSAVATLHVAEQAQNVGAADWLMKPIGRELLKHAMERAVRTVTTRT